MGMSKPQRGVLAGMALGLVGALIVFGLVIWLAPSVAHPATLLARGWLFALSALLPVITLAAAIGRLAGHRFFTPQDLDGSGLTQGTDQARLLQSLLQNTLEQTVLAIPVYAAWAALAPERFLAVAPASACLFFVGRLLFFGGYRRGASGRAFGFALTFYPTIVLLLGTIVCAILVISK